MADIELRAAGRVHRAWTRVEVTRSIEDLAGRFSFEATERWPHRTITPFMVIEGDRAEVAIDGEVVIDGFVDVAEVELDAQSHAMKFSGRSRTADLVDCSAEHAGQWSDRTVLDIARDLVGPFGLTAKAHANVGSAIRRFALEQGETVHEAIERAARMRGLLVTSDLDGVVLARASSGPARVSLEPADCLRARRVGSLADRFSRYVVKGQSAGSDDLFGESASAPKAVAEDSRVARYRPLIVLAEGTGTNLARRAVWERNVRAGRAQRISLTLQGWRGPTGRVWMPNELVHLEHEALRVSSELLVVSVLSRLDRGGSTTELELTFPGAFDVEPLPEPKARSAWA